MDVGGTAMTFYLKNKIAGHTFSRAHNNPMIGPMTLFSHFIVEEVKDERD